MHNKAHRNATNVSLPSLSNCQRTKRRDKVSRREAQQISRSPNFIQVTVGVRWSERLFLRSNPVNPYGKTFAAAPSRISRQVIYQATNRGIPTSNGVVGAYPHNAASADTSAQVSTGSASGFGKSTVTAVLPKDSSSNRTSSVTYSAR